MSAMRYGAGSMREPGGLRWGPRCCWSVLCRRSSTRFGRRCRFRTSSGSVICGSSHGSEVPSAIGVAYPAVVRPVGRTAGRYPCQTKPTPTVSSRRATHRPHHGQVAHRHLPDRHDVFTQMGYCECDIAMACNFDNAVTQQYRAIFIRPTAAVS